MEEINKALDSLFGKQPEELLIENLKDIKNQLKTNFSIKWLNCVQNVEFKDSDCLICDQCEKPFCLYGKLVRILNKSGNL